MSTTYKTIKLSEIFKRSQGKPKYVLPNFQRDFVWDVDGQQALIASFMAGLPVGSILIMEGESKNFSSREFGMMGPTTPLPQCSFILDGQQRLSTLKNAFSDPYYKLLSWESTWKGVFSKIRLRWYIDLSDVANDIDGVDDILGLADLKFNSYGISSLEQDQVREYLGHWKIFKKDADKYYHPGFQSALVKSKKFEERNQLISKKMAPEFQIPLWELDQGGEGLHHAVVDDISSIIAKKKIAKELDEKKANGKITKAQSDAINAQWVKRAAKWASDVENWLDNLFMHSEVPSIELTESELPRAVGIFEAINRGGTPLSVFDLVVARSAVNVGEKSLSQIILEQLAKPLQLKPVASEEQFVKDMKKFSGNNNWGWSPDEMFLAVKEGGLTTRTQNQFLNLLSLMQQTNRINVGKADLNSLDVEAIKKQKILSLTADEISKGTAKVVRGLSRAMAFLQFRCGVRSFEDLPYQLMILPIAYVVADDLHWNNNKIINKIEYWFWVSLFAGRYREMQNEACISDVRSLWTWCTEKNAKNPYETNANERLFNVQDYCDEKSLIPDNNEKLDVRTPVKFAVISFILAGKPFDFDSKKERLTAWKWAADLYSNIKCEIHHILPLKSASSLTESSKSIRKDSGNMLNSPLNLTVISDTANRSISALQPSEYMKKIGGWQVANHFASSSYTDVPGEADEARVRRLLKERYASLKTGVWQKLNALSS